MFFKSAEGEGAAGQRRGAQYLRGHKAGGACAARFIITRTAFFDARNSRQVITVMATLLDETGALQALLAGISAAGGSG